MYKLACIHRSGRSLQRFTDIYRKVSWNRSQQISRALIQDATKKEQEDNMEHALCQKKECKKILPTLLVKRGKNWHNTKKNAVAAAIAKRSFYTSIVERSNSDSWSLKRARRAKPDELYKNALAECMKIRQSRQRTLRAIGVVKWNPNPVHTHVEYEAKVIADKNRDAPKTVECKPKLAIINNILANKSSEKAPVKRPKSAEENQPRNLSALKIETLLKKQSKPSLNVPMQKTTPASKKNVNIVYPTYSVKHRLSRTKPYIITQQEQENIPKQEYRVKRNDDTVEFGPKNKKVPTLGKITSAEKVSFLLENTSEKEKKGQDESVNNLIKSHPVVKTPSKVAKMSIRKKYNVILMKNRAKLHIKIQKPEENIEDKEQQHAIKGGIEKPSSSLEPPEKIVNKESEKSLGTDDAKIVAHPLFTNEQHKDVNVRHSKTFLADKTEQFNVEDICLRSKEKYAFQDMVPVENRLRELVADLPKDTEKEAVRSKFDNAAKSLNNYWKKLKQFRDETSPERSKVRTMAHQPKPTEGFKKKVGKMKFTENISISKEDQAKSTFSKIVENNGALHTSHKSPTQKQINVIHTTNADLKSESEVLKRFEAKKRLRSISENLSDYRQKEESKYLLENYENNNIDDSGNKKKEPMMRQILEQYKHKQNEEAGSQFNLRREKIGHPVTIGKIQMKTYKNLLTEYSRINKPKISQLGKKKLFEDKNKLPKDVSDAQTVKAPKAINISPTKSSSKVTQFEENPLNLKQNANKLQNNESLLKKNENKMCQNLLDDTGDNQVDNAKLTKSKQHKQESPTFLIENLKSKEYKMNKNEKKSLLEEAEFNNEDTAKLKRGSENKQESAKVLAENVKLNEYKINTNKWYQNVLEETEFNNEDTAKLKSTENKQKSARMLAKNVKLKEYNVNKNKNRNQYVLEETEFNNEDAAKLKKSSENKQEPARLLAENVKLKEYKINKNKNKNQNLLEETEFNNEDTAKLKRSSENGQQGARLSAENVKLKEYKINKNKNRYQNALEETEFNNEDTAKLKSTENKQRGARLLAKNIKLKEYNINKIKKRYQNALVETEVNNEDTANLKQEDARVLAENVELKEYKINGTKKWYQNVLEEPVGNNRDVAKLGKSSERRVLAENVPSKEFKINKNEKKKFQNILEETEDNNENIAKLLRNNESKQEGARVLAEHVKEKEYKYLLKETDDTMKIISNDEKNKVKFSKKKIFETKTVDEERRQKEIFSEETNGMGIEKIHKESNYDRSSSVEDQILEDMFKKTASERHKKDTKLKALTPITRNSNMIKKKHGKAINFISKYLEFPIECKTNSGDIKSGEKKTSFGRNVTSNLRQRKRPVNDIGCGLLKLPSMPFKEKNKEHIHNDLLKFVVRPKTGHKKINTFFGSQCEKTRAMQSEFDQRESDLQVSIVGKKEMELKEIILKAAVKSETPEKLEVEAANVDQHTVSVNIFISEEDMKAGSNSCPQIRKEPPKPPASSNDKNKKEPPKTKKNVTFPPPKGRDEVKINKDANWDRSTVTSYIDDIKKACESQLSKYKAAVNELLKSEKINKGDKQTAAVDEELNAENTNVDKIETEECSSKLHERKSLLHEQEGAKLSEARLKKELDEFNRKQKKSDQLIRQILTKSRITPSYPKLSHQLLTEELKTDKELKKIKPNCEKQVKHEKDVNIIYSNMKKGDLRKSQSFCLQKLREEIEIRHTSSNVKKENEVKETEQSYSPHKNMNIEDVRKSQSLCWKHLQEKIRMRETSSSNVMRKKQLDEKEQFKSRHENICIDDIRKSQSQCLRKLQEEIGMRKTRSNVLRNNQLEVKEQCSHHDNFFIEDVRKSQSLCLRKLQEEIGLRNYQVTCLRKNQLKETEHHENICIEDVRKSQSLCRTLQVENNNNNEIIPQQIDTGEVRKTQSIQLRCLKDDHKLGTEQSLKKSEEKFKSDAVGLQPMKNRNKLPDRYLRSSHVEKEIIVKAVPSKETREGVERKKSQPDKAYSIADEIQNNFRSNSSQNNPLRNSEVGRHKNKSLPTSETNITDNVETSSSNNKMISSEVKCSKMREHVSTNVEIMESFSKTEFPVPSISKPTEKEIRNQVLKLINEHFFRVKTISSSEMFRNLWSSFQYDTALLTAPNKNYRNLLEESEQTVNKFEILDDYSDRRFNKQFVCTDQEKGILHENFTLKNITNNRNGNSRDDSTFKMPDSNYKKIANVKAHSDSTENEPKRDKDKFGNADFKKENILELKYPTVGDIGNTQINEKKGLAQKLETKGIGGKDGETGNATIVTKAMLRHWKVLSDSSCPEDDQSAKRPEAQNQKSPVSGKRKVVINLCRKCSLVDTDKQQLVDFKSSQNSGNKSNKHFTRPQSPKNQIQENTQAKACQKKTNKSRSSGCTNESVQDGFRKNKSKPKLKYLLENQVNLFKRRSVKMSNKVKRVKKISEINPGAKLEAKIEEIYTGKHMDLGKFNRKLKGHYKKETADVKMKSITNTNTDARDFATKDARMRIKYGNQYSLEKPSIDTQEVFVAATNSTKSKNKNRKELIQKGKVVCNRIRIPPQRLSELVFTPRREESDTTLTREPREKLSEEKESSSFGLDDPKNIKSNDEYSLPEVLSTENGDELSKNMNLKESQIVQSRFEFLKRLHEEFVALSHNNRLKNDEWLEVEREISKTPLSLHPDQQPKNNTVTLVKKLSDQEAYEKKKDVPKDNSPEKPRGDTTS